MLLRKYLAESVGAFAILFAGACAITVSDVYGSVFYVEISLTFGLVVIAMIYVVGNISGARTNPAVAFSRRKG